MINKFRNFIIICLCLVANAHAQTSEPNDSAGKCFSSVVDFLAQTFGAAYAEDENIKTVPFSDGGVGLKKKGESLSWVVDMTPGVNVSRTLLRLRENGEVCVLLDAPFSSSIKFKLSSNGGLPSKVISFDSPPPGFEKIQTEYFYVRKSDSYAIKRCYKIKWSGKKVKISC